MNMSKSQEQAARHFNGPCLVLAGPGSGKTTVITHRTRILIEEYGVNPSNILVITFTKAAAKEMQERFEKMMNGERIPVSFGTFHAVFFRILRFAYNYSGDNILRETEKYAIIRELIERANIECEDINELTSSIISEISAVKGDMINIDNYYSVNCGDEVFRDIYKEYDNRLRRKNVVDFDDMLVMCYELFKARPDILSAWQKKYKYILIDEFQDINRLQYEIMKMLAQPENNLFVVGDDDQSIYRFRGARPEIMLEFPKVYKDVKQIILEENYRSAEEIVKVAGCLIKNNRIRFNKNINAVRGKGSPVVFMNFANQGEENKYLISDIAGKIKNGLNYSDIAVIFRTNIGPRFLVDKLMEYNIPFRMKDSMPNIYDHFIAKNFFSYINIACKVGKREDFLQIINRPNRYISREALTDENSDIQSLKRYYSNKKWMVERLENLEFDLTMLSRMTPFAAVNYIRQKMEYDKYLEEYAAYRKIKPDELISVAEEIAEAAKPFKTYEEWNEHIEKYTKEILERARENNKQKNAVELTTMHSSKGLEYDTVYIIDAVEGVTPHSKAILEDDMEEERRMFYVALTRAKNNLNIYTIDERFDKKVSVSRFVGEMKADFDEFVIGAVVIHKKYGEGVIRRIDDGKCTIYFGKLRKEMIFDIKFAIANGIIKLK